MSDWDSDVSEDARKTMDELGSFSPTVRVEEKLVKGYMLDRDGEAGKTYFSSADLRLMAAHFVEVADWLDRRAQ